jgi:hypothetical protein
MISQGTVSVFLGCHSIIHSILVVKAWKKVYGRWPELWELGCIMVHDVGHIGLDYLDDPKQKAEHWRLGARIAKVFFGHKGYKFVAGHCETSGEELSDLFFPDKVSRAMAPMWWLVFQQLVEPKLTPKGVSRRQHAKDFKEWAIRNVESRNFQDAHKGYMELKSKGDS